MFTGLPVAEKYAFSLATLLSDVLTIDEFVEHHHEIRETFMQVFKTFSIKCTRINANDDGD